MLNTYDLARAMDALSEARDEAGRAEDRRKRAWQEYLVARDYADEARESLHAAERTLVREAGRLAAGERPNRDERRAQVYAGLGDDDIDESPF